MVDNVFILDEHLKVSKVLSIDGQNTFFDDLYISDLSSGTESYEFSTNVNDIEESNYVMFHYKGQYKLFQIVELEQEHNEGKIISTIYCECACLELLNNVVRPFSGEYSCIGFLQHVLEGTGWQIYKYTSTLTSKILSVNVNKSTQVWSCIQDYMHKYGYEINTRVEYNNGYVKAKIIEIYDEGELGEKTYKRFEYGRNVDGIVKKKDLYEWCTALILDTNKDITNVTYDKDGYVKKNGSDVILATNENEKYNLGRAYIYGSYEDNESISGQEVVEKGVEELKRRSVPHFDYECNTALTYKEYKELNIGDTVYVIDHTFSPSITLEARIGKLEISFTDRNNCKCNLTNYKEVKSKIGEDLSSITEQVKNNANNIEELFNNTTIVKSNGEVVLLKDEYNITKDTVDSHTQTIGNLQTTIDSTTGEIVLLKDNFNSTKDTVDSHTQTISSLQTSINGTLTNTVAEYYVSTSSTSQTGGSWSTTSPTWENGKYIWQRMKYTYSNGSTNYSAPVCIQGAKGEDGTGVNILGKYDSLAALNQAHPTGNIGDCYTVNGTLYTWSVESNSWVDCGNIKGEQGEKGDPGEKGQSLTKSTPQWYSSTSNTTQTGGSWVESMPTIDSSHYLWLRYKLDWTNPTATTYTAPTLEQIAENIKEVSKKQSQLEQNLEGFKTTVSETYASKNETSVIEQKINKVEIDFNTSGGYNLLINSSGRGGLNNWISTDTSAFYASTNVLSYPAIKHTESGGVFVGSNSNTSDKYLYSDRFSLCPNATYILYGKIYSSSGMIGSVHLLTSSSIANLEDTSLSYDDIYTCATSPSTGSWEEFSYTFTAPSNISSALIRLSHKCTASGSTNEILFGDLCLIPGSRKRPWTPHPSELYEEKVTIDKTGITVKNSNTNYCSNMSPSGLSIYKEDNTSPIAYFRSEGCYVDNLISSKIYCPSFPRYAHLFELKTDYYVNSTSSGDGLGGDASNCCSSIQQVIDTIKDCGTIIDKDVTIHILNGAAINENIIIGGFYGTGSITLAWEYQTKFYGTINIINNGIKIIYSSENDGSVAGRFVDTTTCAVNKEEAGKRHRIYSDTGVVPITVQNSYVEINNSIFIRSNFTKPSEVTTDYSLNVKENGYVYLYGNDFVYNYAVGYVERTGKVVLDYNSGTTYYRFHGRERGHVSEGQYTFRATTVNELVEPFAILYDGGRMYSSDAYERSSYYINQGYNTDPNYTPITEGENTFRLSPTYEASPLRNLEVAYKHVGLVLGSDGNEVFQGSFFLEEKDYPKLFNVLKNKTIMSMRLSLTRVADSVNPDNRVDIYTYTHDASQYFDSNIAIGDTVSLNFSSSLINSLVSSARNNSYIKMQLLSNRTTLSDQTLTDYAAFNRNAVILYIEYGV